MTDWNKVSRSDVEAAAAQGDTEAQTVLRMHQRLDRIHSSLDELRVDINKSFNAIDATIDAICDDVRARRKQ